MEWLKEFLKPELIWFLIGLLLLLAEFMIPGLIVFFFGVGAWIVAVCCLATDITLNVQLLIFIISSMLLLVLLRSWVKGIFTGYASLEGEARAAQLDFYEYLPKSNWYDLLLPTIERVLAEPERPMPKQRPIVLEEAAAQYVEEGKWELAAMALEQAARIAEFTHEWEHAARLYSQAFEHMQRARGLSVESQRLRELAECAQRIADEGTEA